MTENEKLVNTMSDYEVTIVAEGLREVIKHSFPATKNDITAILDYLSNRYGGYGLIAVMDALRNK